MQLFVIVESVVGDVSGDALAYGKGNRRIAADGRYHKAVSLVQHMCCVCIFNVFYLVATS